VDVRGNHSSEDVQEDQGLTTVLPEWARERAEGRWYGPPTAGQSPQQAKRGAATNLIVVVSHKGGDDWAKARVLANPGQATTLVQELVEGGLAPEQVTVFSATQLTVNVGYRPVVELKRRRK
jgi:hypothetical protein